MGKSLRSKRMNRNRNLKRVRTAPKEVEKLKAALAFEYNEQNSKEHLSIFHDVVNGPPPALPGLEPGSKIAKVHLTESHITRAILNVASQRRADSRRAAAQRALDPTAQSYDTHPRDAFKKKPDPANEEKMDDKEPRNVDPITLRDQYGHYPVWMNAQQVYKRARGNRLKKKKEKKRLGKKNNSGPKFYIDGINKNASADSGDEME